MNIRLLPAGPSRALFDELRTAATRATSVRAAVAYWTIGPDYVPDELAQRLRAPGFLCVDLHRPTNVDHLADLHRRGAEVYLYLSSAGRSIETEANHPETMPSALMHTKMWLFDRGDEAELWVGSHNFTRRAMMGVNIEASLSLALSSKDETPRPAAETMLEEIRALSERFDPTKIDHYKWLQGENEETTVVLTLEGTEMRTLAGRRILLLTENAELLGKLRRLGRDVIVVAIDAAGGDWVYDAHVTKIGDVAPADRVGSPLSFHEMRYAWLRSRPAATLEAADVVTAASARAAVGYTELALTSSPLARDSIRVPRDSARRSSMPDEAQDERVGARELLPGRAAPFILSPAPFQAADLMTFADRVRGELAAPAPQPVHSRREWDVTPLRKAVVRRQ